MDIFTTTFYPLYLFTYGHFYNPKCFEFLVKGVIMVVITTISKGGVDMCKRVCFIGHRIVPVYEIRDKLKKIIIEKINDGFVNFVMGLHGNFDMLALRTCLEIKKTYPNIKIEVVITSLNQLKKINLDSVQTIMYEIEEVHFKRQILLSNQKMIDDANFMICYVDDTKAPSGAVHAFKYAEKQKKSMINLFVRKAKSLAEMQKFINS